MISSRWSKDYGKSACCSRYRSTFFTAESFNDRGEGGCNTFVLVLGRNGTKIAPPGDFLYQPPGEMS